MPDGSGHDHTKGAGGGSGRLRRANGRSRWYAAATSLLDWACYAVADRQHTSSITSEEDEIKLFVLSVDNAPCVLVLQYKIIIHEAA